MKSGIYRVRGVYLKNMYLNIRFYRICMYLFYKYLQILINIQIYWKIINILLKQIKYIENYNK